MAKIEDYVKQEGLFLKADKIKPNTEAVIIGEATMVHNDKFDTERLHIPIEIEKEQWTFDCSKTNARVIAEKLGEDTTAWNGKVIVLGTYRTKLGDGRMVDAINVESVKI